MPKISCTGKGIIKQYCCNKTWCFLSQVFVLKHRIEYSCNKIFNFKPIQVENFTNKYNLIHTKPVGKPASVCRDAIAQFPELLKMTHGREGQCLAEEDTVTP